MNNLILPETKDLTMTSSQLAEMLGYEKKEINRKIKSIFQAKIDGGVITPSFDKRGYVSEYNLPELESKMFVARHDITYLEKITKYWIDRNKNTNQFQIPQTLGDALQLAANQAKQLEIQAPKVAFVDRFVASTGNKTFREVAKILKANEREFRAMLLDSKVMYKLGGSWVARSEHINAGRFYVTGGEKNGHAYTDCKFTPKGVEYIAGKWITHKELSNGNS